MEDVVSAKRICSLLSRDKGGWRSGVDASRHSGVWRAREWLSAVQMEIDC